MSALTVYIIMKKERVELIFLISIMCQMFYILILTSIVTLNLYSNCKRYILLLSSFYS